MSILHKPVQGRTITDIAQQCRLLEAENRRLYADYAQLREEIAALRLDRLRAEINQRFETIEARLAKLERR